MFKEICSYRLPDIDTLEILFIPPDDEKVREFFLNSIPKKMNNFSFNYTNVAIIEWNKYLYQLMTAAMCTIEFFNLWNMTFSWSEFWKIIMAAGNWNLIFFESWNIETDTEWDFNNIIEWKLKRIGIQYSSKSSFDQCKGRFTNIISGISKCKALKASLNQIILAFKGSEYLDTESILTSFGLNNIEILL